MSNKVIRYLLLIAVLAVVAVLAFNKVKKDKALAAEGKTMMRGRTGALLVDAFVVKPVPLKTSLEATGTLLSNEMIQVQSEVNGRITHLYFKEGTHVRKGELMVTLFDEDLKAQVRKLHVQQELAKTTLERQKQLLAINGISRQDVDITQNQVAAYEADIANAEALISKTEIRAPFDGRVGLRQVSEGALVAPGDMITTLYQNNPLKLEFSIPEKYRNQIRIGDQVQFSVASSEGQFPGKVYAINPGIDPSTRTLTLRAWVNNSQEKLSPGSFANVHIELREIAKALMIPSQSLIPTTKNGEVVVCRDGKAQFVTVETGVQTPDKIQIINGLKAGDTVLTTGLMQASPGAALEIKHIETADSTND